MTPASVHDMGAASPTRRKAAALRFLTELGAWAAVGTAVAHVSLPLAVAVVLAAIAIPAVYATPGDKPHVFIPVPGRVTLAILAATMAGGIVAAWIAWPWWAATALSVLTSASVVAELPRWRRLLRARR
ncbi:hypothetical protein K3N28_17035 [Glycomyces sp. TRM65418]|uniref:hypothetical protein n=1 Tax=Glycomyces sp. TRM65418 TaxID=2867006 RepID=UPI001CE59AD6|nr:hypothetical protein [Glycomyces sp. TRM65418]MCC3764764.1 hypothetical protein [Glycomyces sp. TRM65418]QZD54418.1 hypothetical protein K3N28_16950 [Glycomyces sp. TRM65418]